MECAMSHTMTNVDIVATGRRVRKSIGFTGLALVFATFWFVHMAIDTGDAACPPHITISDINHGAGGPECGKSMVYWLFAVASLFASAWAVLAWLAMWIMSFFLTIVRR
jgi:hypothetical protein